MTPPFCCAKALPAALSGDRHLRLDFTAGEARQLYTAVLAYYGDPAAAPLDRNDSAAAADLNGAACTLYLALRNTAKSAL
jgi:hypothetical protein